MSCKKCGKPANGYCDTCKKGCIFVDGKCVQYTGPTTDYLQIPNGLNLNDIILGLDSTIANLQDQILNLNAGLTINIADTPTIHLGGNGATNPLTADLKISATPGNSLSVATDGLYVPESSQIYDVVRLSSNGLGLTYSFPHNSLVTPNGVLLTAGSQDAADFAYVDVDSTYVTVFYSVAPIAGSNNLKYFYTVY